MTYQSFEDLDVWKLSRDFRNEIFMLVKGFPDDKKYKLTDQIIRSSRSVTANIAEGYGRFHYQENIQFCRMARGSVTETKDHLICAFDCRYISEEVLSDLNQKYEVILQKLNDYISYLKMKKGN